MLDVQAVAGFLFKPAGSGGDSMDQDDTAEARLEAALERIARHMDAPDPIATEIAARLDNIITTLRDALDK